MSKRNGKLMFVEVLDVTDNTPVWVRPEDIRQIARRDKGESTILLASGDAAWYPMGATKYAKWLAKEMS